MDERLESEPAGGSGHLAAVTGTETGVGTSVGRLDEVDVSRTRRRVVGESPGSGVGSVSSGGKGPFAENGAVGLEWDGGSRMPVAGRVRGRNRSFSARPFGVLGQTFESVPEAFPVGESRPGCLRGTLDTPQPPLRPGVPGPPVWVPGVEGVSGPVGLVVLRRRPPGVNTRRICDQVPQHVPSERLGVRGPVETPPGAPGPDVEGLTSVVPGPLTPSSVTLGPPLETGGPSGGCLGFRSLPLRVWVGLSRSSTSRLRRVL